MRFLLRDSSVAEMLVTDYAGLYTLRKFPINVRAGSGKSARAWMESLLFRDLRWLGRIDIYWRDSAGSHFFTVQGKRSDAYRVSASDD
jgi:hypothetical protein